MITLQHGQPVRAAKWADTVSAEVFTVAGYAAKNGLNPAKLEQKEIKLGRSIASTCYYPGALVGDRELARQMVAADRAKAAQAVTLAAGDVVEIEGRRYTVRFPQNGDKREFPTVSDPIHFIAA